MQRYTEYIEMGKTSMRFGQEAKYVCYNILLEMRSYKFSIRYLHSTCPYTSLMSTRIRRIEANYVSCTQITHTKN